MMEITLDQARCFCALVEEGSYQGAAKALRRSHPAVVYAIGSFEKQCNVPLLNRSGYRTQITPTGRAIYLLCRELLESAEQLKQRCQDFKAGWESAVRIVYDGVLSSRPFLELFQHFKKEKVPTLLDIYADYLAGVEKSFHDLECHFMISVLPVQSLKAKNLVSVALDPIALTLVAKSSHPLIQSKKRWTTQGLKKFNFFTVRGANASLDLGTQSLEEASTFHLSDFSLKKEAILEGAGFGWLPGHLIESELQSGQLRPIHWEHPHQRELHPRLYYAKQNTRGLACQRLFQSLKTTFIS